MCCDFDYADQFLEKLSKNVDIKRFFHPNEIKANEKEIKHHDKTCQRIMKIYSLESDLNFEMYNKGNRLNQNALDMPSGEVFEALSKEY